MNFLNFNPKRSSTSRTTRRGRRGTASKCQPRVSNLETRISHPELRIPNPESRILEKKTRVFAEAQPETQLDKPDNQKGQKGHRWCRPDEFWQMAGRAGRRGMDTQVRLQAKRKPLNCFGNFDRDRSNMIYFSPSRGLTAKIAVTSV